MKGRIVFSSLFSLALGLSSLSLAAASQDDPPPVVSDSPSVVTVLATDAAASEDGPDTGTFQITRTGATNDALTVYYSLGGSARNGSDYKMLPALLVIPAGSFSADVTVTPILDVDRTPETNETVVLQLHPLIDVRPGRPAPYAIGWPSNAVVTISESANPPTNRPPVIHLISPPNGSDFISPANLELVAESQDPDGTVKSVEFFVATSTATNSLGVVTNALSSERFKDLFTLDWTNISAGTYTLTAKATDDDGAATISDAIQITVVSRDLVPVVTVTASDPDASELGPDPGIFTITRTGDASSPLAVYYTLGGTAQNGIDYQHLAGIVNFPAGTSKTNITVTPIPDLDPTAHTNDTVLLQIAPLLDLRVGMAGLYFIGSPSNAVVNIAENSNAFPVVTVVATDSNAAEDGPDTGTFEIARTGNTNLALTVYYALGGSAQNGRDYKMLPSFVTFAPGTDRTNVTVVPILDVDHKKETNETVVLQLHPRVDLVRTADNGYAIGWPSNAVVTIAESANPPTNEPPVVKLVSPADGAGFVAPASIQLLAQAKDPDGKVSSVEFFAATSTATNSISVVSNTVPSGRYRGLFSFNWTNVAVGNYVLTAKATDDQGGTGTSSPTHVTVTATALPKINIAASDPVASIGPRGTNSATFLVRRTEGTNLDLVVYYTLSGTASNGVDYVKLPGAITIPAGHLSATITIEPLPATSLTGNRLRSVTVALQGAPTTGSNPPPYLLGTYRQATAVILGNASRRLTPGRLDNGFFQIVLSAAQPSSYRVEVSTNLLDWQAIGSCDANADSLQFVDPDATDQVLRFYRAVPESDDGQE